MLPVVDEVEKSAENGCDSWKANADETERTTRAQIANLAKIRCFKVYLLQT
jgi:hypothetical protein